MSSTSETGHAKNVANFETLISFVTGYGTTYNPSNAAIQLTSLQTKAAEAKATMENMHNLLAANKIAIADRKTAFDPLNSLSTRIFNSLKATNASQAIIESAATNHRKLQGRRASALLSEAEKQSMANAGTPVNQVSASQQSFDSRLDSLDKQIRLLSTIAAYAPNETDLQVATLTNQYNDLLEKNKNVTDQNSALSSGRINRNGVLYDPEIGMVALAFDTKNYTKSLYGAAAPEFKQISGLRIQKINI